MPPIATARRAISRAAVGLLTAAAGAAVLPATRAGAQTPAPVVERPAPFDSAGRVLLVTPALVARLRLAPPAWPVRGPFVEARLFDAPVDAPNAGAAGPAVLSVTRPGGAVERYALGAAERAALTAAVAAGLAAAGSGLRSDTAVVVSEPAGRAFVRNQTALGLLLYGPAAAVLVGADNAGATLAYAAGAGAAFAVSLATSRQRPVTRAQAILSGNMGLGIAAAGAGLLALGDVNDGRAYAGAVLAGGVGGSILGFQRAAGLTDAEAAASASAAFLGVATVAGVAGALDAYTGDRYRPTIGAGIAALGAGYAFGPRYARTRAYRVTAGDVQTLTPLAFTGAALGAAAGWAASNGGAQGTWLGATAGFVSGTVLADRLLVRRLDHTTSEADLVQLGFGVGAGLGAALGAAADVQTAAGLTLTGLGALAGLGFAEALLKPAPDGGRRLRTSFAPSFAPPLAPPGRLRLSPAGLAMARLAAARGGRGTFPLATLTF